MSYFQKSKVALLRGFDTSPQGPPTPWGPAKLPAFPDPQPPGPRAPPPRAPCPPSLETVLHAPLPAAPRAGQRRPTPQLREALRPRTRSRPLSRPAHAPEAPDPRVSPAHACVLPGVSPRARAPTRGGAHAPARPPQRRPESVPTRERAPRGLSPLSARLPRPNSPPAFPRGSKARTARRGEEAGRLRAQWQLQEPREAARGGSSAVRAAGARPLPGSRAQTRGALPAAAGRRLRREGGARGPRTRTTRTGAQGGKLRQARQSKRS
ncbi:proline-rich protein HaeIII subfamily 1-like [Artibeus jamaicensis]|uniref:proline-rich protein HaeIII subfamily 1-like n=1 Tax=Artibeus jamaicensis TaxID=9417 RepID=UPI00235ABDE1|nr:proline-rich protein HaeIII subfamily 1-like [Artibeus jamaicensis]